MAAWYGADLIHIARPRNHEGLLAPHIFEQRAVRPLREAGFMLEVPWFQRWSTAARGRAVLARERASPINRSGNRTASFGFLFTISIDHCRRFEPAQDLRKQWPTVAPTAA